MMAPVFEELLDATIEHLEHLKEEGQSYVPLNPQSFETLRELGRDIPARRRRRRRRWSSSSPGARSRAFRALAAKLIATDSERAAEVYLEGGKPESGHYDPNGYSGREFHWGKIVREHARTDPVGAFEWARKVGGDRSIPWIISQSLPRSADQAIDYLAQLSPEFFAASDAAASVGAPSSWSANEVPAAIARLQEIPNPGVRAVAHSQQKTVFWPMRCVVFLRTAGKFATWFGLMTIQPLW